MAGRRAETACGRGEVPVAIRSPRMLARVLVEASTAWWNGRSGWTAFNALLREIGGRGSPWRTMTVVGMIGSCAARWFTPERGRRGAGGRSASGQAPVPRRGGYRGGRKATDRGPRDEVRRRGCGRGRHPVHGFRHIASQRRRINRYVRTLFQSTLARADGPCGYGWPTWPLVFKVNSGWSYRRQMHDPPKPPFERFVACATLLGLLEQNKRLATERVMPRPIMLERYL